jgi:hypothetical protein
VRVEGRLRRERHMLFVTCPSAGFGFVPFCGLSTRLEEGVCCVRYGLCCGHGCGSRAIPVEIGGSYNRGVWLWGVQLMHTQA